MRTRNEADQKLTSIGGSAALKQAFLPSLHTLRLETQQ